MIRRMVLSFLLCLTSIPFCTGSGVSSSAQGALMVKKEAFGTTPDGKAVEIYTLTNTHGIEVRVMTYGGIIVSVKTPDKSGHVADITLGFDTLAGYLAKNPFFGALVGRYGNRIGNAKFTLDGKEYTLAKNNGPNALHGGLKGFDKVVWQAAILPEERRSRRDPEIHQRRRRRGLSRDPPRDRHLHAERQERIQHRLSRHDGQGHTHQPHQPHLLQPGGRGERNAFSAKN